MLSPFPLAGALFATALLCGSYREPNADGQVADPPRFSANLAVTHRPSPPASSVRPGTRLQTITKAPDGLFYVTGRVNGTRVRFLVDTGANLVVLTPDDARRIGLAHGSQRPFESIETAGGQSGIARVSLKQVAVAGRRLSDIDAAVMNDGMRVSLLGQNVLSKLGPISISGDEITLQAQPESGFGVD